MHPIITIATRAARRAGNVIVRHLDRLDRLEVESKGKNDFVSQVDRLAETEIIQVLRHAYPDHAILAEESGAQEGNDYEWIIDPLDGTTNYLHGFPQFAVSIALRYRGELQHGLVFDPLRDELFTASRGNGAYLNDRRIRVSKVTQLEDALLGTGFPFRALSKLDLWLLTFRALFPRCSGIRRAGAAALDLAYVATGRFDGFWEMDLSPWDLAAGCLLIQEAGGLLSDFDGEANYLKNGNIVAANSYIYNEMHDIIKKLVDAKHLPPRSQP
ncbi:MAG: inositol monophosphatase [Gammaproteobacteria bacterium]|nr:inositol monophosphatase [Gammaproteobacteria bacterium]